MTAGPMGGPAGAAMDTRGKRGQTVCKPGSVHLPEKDGRPFLWDAPCGTPHATNPNDGAEEPPTVPQATRLPFLFGLAPGGVCPAARVAAGAVRSYRTVSPLPAPSPANRNAVWAVCFLWHFPWGRPRRPLAGTVPPWSPDFPPSHGNPCDSGRPTAWLAETDCHPGLRQGGMRRIKNIERASGRDGAWISRWRDGSSPG